jgi:hypothetical protein
MKFFRTIPDSCEVARPPSPGFDRIWARAGA